jgi:hypothetical protein
MDCDLDGIHFINGRFDCRTGQFTEREHPNFNRPETFVTVFIPYPFDVVNKDLCDTVYDSLLKSFGSREKWDYCLAYAGAALNRAVQLLPVPVCFMWVLEDPVKPLLSTGSRLP